jgi:hypothetical protein
MLIIQIHNDGTGNKETANYTYAVFVNQENIAQGEVKNHKRHRGWIELLKSVIEDAQSEEYLIVDKLIDDLHEKKDVI